MEYWKKVDKISQDKTNKLYNDLDIINSHWIGISLPNTDINIKNQEKELNYIKIYLSINNSSLHLFTNQFLLSCLEYEYNDFDFKINKDENINRRDNVVIYCTTKNFGQYVKLVQEVIQNNPEISFNQPHLLGIPYDEHIYCGFDFHNEKTSYTDKLCKGIFEALQKGKSPEEIADSINGLKLKNSSCINDMINTSSNFGVKH